MMEQSVNHAFRLIILTLEDMQKRLANLEKKAVLFQQFIERCDDSIIKTGSSSLGESDSKIGGGSEENL